SISVMCRRISTGARAHSTGVSGEELFARLESLLPAYAPDVFIFLGSRGCKHFWAASKLFSDALHEKYGFPMLQMDVDNTDSSYKSLDEVKRELAEYLDTVINKN
ncbi:MAG: 2-hydroxyacyl-CoA dehydratase family protein, partial [Bacillota bacterium]